MTEPIDANVCWADNCICDVPMVIGRTNLGRMRGPQRLECSVRPFDGRTMFVCEGLTSELNDAWNWPACIRWDNSSQALIHEFGTREGLS